MSGQVDEKLADIISKIRTRLGISRRCVFFEATVRLFRDAVFRLEMDVPCGVNRVGSIALFPAACVK